ncbi:MAG: hypothetical protein RL619_1779 [Bacteroidota bacterium]|jgi:hypothetical protein
MKQKYSKRLLQFWTFYVYSCTKETFCIFNSKKNDTIVILNNP